MTYLKSRAADLLRQINETHRPVSITQNGEVDALAGGQVFAQNVAVHPHQRGKAADVGDTGEALDVAVVFVAIAPKFLRISTDWERGDFS